MSTGGIVSIGECMVELSTLGGETWRMGFAGDTLNTLWTLRALSPEDRPAGYVTAFGDDPFSARQMAFFRENSIGTAKSPIIPGARPGLYAIMLDGAERSFTYWRSDSAARQLASDPEALRESLRDQALVYFSGITLAILDAPGRQTLLQAVAEARAAGSLIAFDPNYRPSLWNSREEAHAAMSDALAVTDIALPTFPDEQMLHDDMSPEQTARRMQAAGVPETVVKNGAEPALVALREHLKAIEAIRVGTPVDTTGAGDSFNGAYLAARLAGHNPAEAARRAHRVAAAVVQVRGALAPLEVLRETFGV